MKLIFVYNANTGLFSQVTDSVHKILSPKTYKCNLCKLTYGNVLIKQEWKKFIDTLPHELVFLHKNEFEKQYPKYKSEKLPAIFVEQANNLKLIVTAKEINQVNSIKKLITLVTNAIASL